MEEGMTKGKPTICVGIDVLKDKPSPARTKPGEKTQSTLNNAFHAAAR
jgi:hypothetical protein